MRQVAASMVTDRQTQTQNDYCKPAAHAQRVKYWYKYQHNNYSPSMLFIHLADSTNAAPFPSGHRPRASYRNSYINFR